MQRTFHSPTNDARKSIIKGFEHSFQGQKNQKSLNGIWRANETIVHALTISRTNGCRVPLLPWIVCPTIKIHRTPGYIVGMLSVMFPVNCSYWCHKITCSLPTHLELWRPHNSYFFQSQSGFCTSSLSQLLSTKHDSPTLSILGFFWNLLFDQGPSPHLSS